MQIPFGTRSYVNQSLPISAQRLVNWYAEIQPPDAGTQVALLPCPGLVSFATCGTGPIRGMVYMGSLVYVVSGSELYSLSSAGTATLLGSLTPSARVSIADNGTQVFIACGSKGYIYSVAGGLVEITDADFPGADVVDFQDGYFIFNNPGTNQVFSTALYDGTSIDALDFASAEAHPDNLISLISDHRELWLFGAQSTEVWYNAGASAFPFERTTTIEKGCIAKYSITKLDNSVFWLGTDPEAGGHMVYRANGYEPVRISDHAIEAAISRYTTISDAFAWAYVRDGHAFYVLTFPTEKTCWVFDVASQRWHERESYDEDRYRVNAFVAAFNKHLVGDYETGAIYYLDNDVYTDAGNAIVRTTTSPPIRNQDKYSAMSYLEAEFDHGVGLTSGQGSDPMAGLDWSDDGGRTWSNRLWMPIGKKGEYTRQTIWRRLGTWRGSRVFRITVSDPVKPVLLNVWAG